MEIRFTFVEGEVVAEAASALNSLAALIRQRPERADALRQAVIAKLDKHGWLLVAELGSEVPE